MQLRQDLLYSLRSFSRNPGMVAVVVISIALGIAANTTVFSLVNATLLGTLPVPKADRLVVLNEASSFPYPDYTDFRDQTDVFEGLSARFPLVPASLGGGEPERVWGQLVSANYFDVLGLPPVLGRGFLPDERLDSGNKPAVVVLSDGLWRRRFGADANVLGTGAILNNREYTVVGVMPPGFYGEDRGFVGEFWVPLAMVSEIMPDVVEGSRFDRREASWLSISGRLKPGVSREQATAALNVVQDRIDAEFRKDNNKRDPIELSTAGGVPAARAYVLGLMVVLMIVVGLVLLIACANVANILLARAMGRQREIGIRLAIGANRWRLIQQLLTESTLLAVMASGAGVVLAYFATRVISQARLPVPIPVSFDFTPNMTVLAFTAALTLVTGVLFGLAPAFRATRTDLVTSLKDSGAAASTKLRRFGMRNILVTVQVGLSIILLVSAGLFLRSLGNASSIDTGMRADNVLLLGFDPKLHAYTPERTRQFLIQLHDRVVRLPGIESASFVDVVPLSIGSRSSRFNSQPPPEDQPKGFSAEVLNVGPDYFRTLGIPLLHGRDFTLADQSRKTAMINKTMAERMFGAENPIGRQLTGRGGPWEITGIAANTKHRTLGEAQRNIVYRLAHADPGDSLSLFGISLIAKTYGDPHQAIPAVRAQVKALDPNLAVFGIETMREHFDKALLIPRLSAILLGIFGAVGLTLATVGLYGVISYSVRRRTREIGIRVALGAKGSAVMGAVLKQGLWLTGVGVVAGLAIAAALSRLFETYLYGIRPGDPWTLAAVALCLTSIAVVATLIPARRAARVEPSVALRCD